MARPPRIEFPGAIYHVTSRGDRREPIFVDDDDRSMLLAVVAHVGRAETPAWLNTAGLHGNLPGCKPRDAADARRAAER